MKDYIAEKELGERFGLSKESIQRLYHETDVQQRTNETNEIEFSVADICKWLAKGAKPTGDPCWGSGRSGMNEIMTEEELCRAFSVSRTWVWLNRTKAGLPFLRVGGVLRYQAAEVLDWFKAKSQSSKQKRSL